MSIVFDTCACIVTYYEFFNGIHIYIYYNYTHIIIYNYIYILYILYIFVWITLGNWYIDTLNVWYLWYGSPWKLDPAGRAASRASRGARWACPIATTVVAGDQWMGPMDPPMDPNRSWSDSSRKITLFHQSSTVFKSLFHGLTFAK